VLEEHQAIAGFFPFQGRHGAGEPAGGRLADHHGVIASAETRWDWQELLRAAGLGYWQFDHLPYWQRPHGVAVTRALSPALDLSQGHEAWLRRRLAASRSMHETLRKMRKLEREAGPLRLEPNSRDRAVFDTVIRLKREQCVRTGQLDFFAWPWTRALVECIRDIDEPAFGGRLSALYAGDTLVAAHFGMRSDKVWHWWFPVYNHAYGSHSPGLALLMRLAEHAAAEGHLLLDLGKGDEAYKDRFSDCAMPLAEGLVSRPALATAVRRLRKAAGAWLRTSPYAQPLRPLVQRLRPGAAAGAPVAIPLTDLTGLFQPILLA